MTTETHSAEKRRYEKRRRAEQEAETRRRITEATVELHGTIGPARTTVSAIAERAGVQRATVYRHFPDEDRLFDACTSHFMAANPVPDLEAWAAIAEPAERLATALGDLYGWYDATSYMLDNTTRDAALVPALEPSMAQFAGYMDAAVQALLRGRPERGGARRRARAAIGHAIAYATWRSLVREQGLSRHEAVAVMRAAVAAAGAAR